MAFQDRKWLYHATPPWVRAENARFFLTVCCKERGREQLTRPELAEGIFDSIRFGQARGDWYVRLILLMPDHLHMIASFPDHEVSMTKRISDWKRLMARRHKIVWQKAFFDHRLRNDAALDEKAAYIRMNPVRAGLCKQHKDWPYIWEPDRS
jgi:putative transposase